MNDECSVNFAPVSGGRIGRLKISARVKQPACAVAVRARKTHNERKIMPRMRVSVVSDQPDEYKSKAGTVVKSQVLSCQDMCQSGARLKNTFDYTYSDEEKASYAGKLVDKVIELDVTELSPAPFGGRLRARGRIHSTPLDAKK